MTQPTETESDLHPCPLCGSHAFDWRAGGYNAVQCDNMGDGKENCPLHGIKMTPEQWNTRAQPDTGVDWEGLRKEYPQGGTNEEAYEVYGWNARLDHIKKIMGE